MIITISGMPGGGKTTLARYLAKIFKLKFYDIGDLRRRIALKREMSLTEWNKFGEKDFITDKIPDHLLKDLAKRKIDNIVVDGRMAFYFIPNAIKIFVKVDLKEGAKRIFKHHRKGEKYKTIKETYNALVERVKSDKKRYKKYYHINVFDLNHYNIILDSTNMSLAESKKTIKKSVEKFIKTQSDKRP